MKHNDRKQLRHLAEIGQADLTPQETLELLDLVDKYENALKVIADTRGDSCVKKGCVCVFEYADTALKGAEAK